MSIFKRILYILPFVILQCSCLNLFPNKNKDIYTATVTLQKEGDTPYFITDDNNIILTTTEKIDDYTHKIGNRFFISYTISTQYSETQIEISVNSIIELKNSDIITSDYTTNKNTYCIPKMVWFSGNHLNCIFTAAITDINKHDFIMILKGIESNTLSLEVIHTNDNDSESVNRDFAFTYDIEKYIKEYNIQNISLVYQDLYKGKETISIKIQ